MIAEKGWRCKAPGLKASDVGMDHRMQDPRPENTWTWLVCSGHSTAVCQAHI
jgi:hypothetical protein